MTEDEERAKNFELRARRDIQDIRALREFDPFQRYFLRRLKQRREELAQAFRHDPEFVVKKNEKGEEYRATLCTKEDREILRSRLDEVESMLKLLETDEGSARVSLERMA